MEDSQSCVVASLLDLRAVFDVVENLLHERTYPLAEQSDFAL